MEIVFENPGITICNTVGSLYYTQGHRRDPTGSFCNTRQLFQMTIRLLVYDNVMSASYNH